MSKTIEQRRAAAAWEHVGPAPPKEYVALVQGAPAAIHTAGLGQTVAFYLSRKDRAEYAKLLTHLATWVLRARRDADPDASKGPDDLMTAIQSGSSDDYRRLTAETLAYLAWLKRFAAARRAGPAAASDSNPTGAHA